MIDTFNKLEYRNIPKEKLTGEKWMENTDTALVRENMKKHNPKSPFLLGESMPEDVIHEAVQKTWIDRQLQFDFSTKK